MSSSGPENRRRRRRSRKPDPEFELTPDEFQALLDETTEHMLKCFRILEDEDSVPNEDHSVNKECQQDLLDSIVRQMEFYFSDDNLPTDTFLLNQVNSNDGGYGKSFREVSSNFPLPQLRTQHP